MVPEPDRPVSARPDDEVQISPLEQRLSTMDWPKPPPGVRDRLFEQIVARADHDGANDSDSDEGPASDDADQPGAEGAAGRG